MAEEGRVAAVIDIGSTAIRAIVAQIDTEGEWHRLDRASMPVNLGRDVFLSGSLSRESMQQATSILVGYSELLRGWAVPRGETRVIATSAIREARNRDTFVDRVAMRTGLRIEVIEGIEENYLTFLAVQHAVAPMRGEFSRVNSLIIEVGGGTTDMMLLQRGKMVAAHSLRIGTVRSIQQVDQRWGGEGRLEGVIKDNVRVTLERLNTEMKLGRIRYFIAVGGDARLVARAVGTKEEDHYWIITRAAYEEFVSRLKNRSTEQVVRDQNISYADAESLASALLIYKLFLDATAAETLIVPDVSIREGVLLSLANSGRWSVEREFADQIIASARNLARRYSYDESHALHVAKLALILFDQLSAEHGMDARNRLILEVAAILHDVGTYLKPSGHHKHGYYIVLNSEIFGISKGDLEVIANIVRYHRKAQPSTGHENFISLRREQRVAVLKLAAILRIADALDRGHNQRVRDLWTEIQDSDLVIRCKVSGDMSVERHGMAAKADMFEEVFGLSIVLSEA